MMRWLLVLALFLPFPIHADTLAYCWPYEQIAQSLAHKFGEKPVVMGAREDGTRIEILVSREQTFTILIVRPDNNMACMVLSGEGWTVIPQGQGS